MHAFTPRSLEVSQDVSGGGDSGEATFSLKEAHGVLA
jgi:hypothetical protein